MHVSWICREVVSFQSDGTRPQRRLPIDLAKSLLWILIRSTAEPSRVDAVPKLSGGLYRGSRFRGLSIPLRVINLPSVAKLSKAVYYLRNCCARLPSGTVTDFALLKLRNFNMGLDFLSIIQGWKLRTNNSPSGGKMLTSLLLIPDRFVAKRSWNTT